eukprot:354296-Chlamydomonas_euryale.AAC.6
MSQRRRRHRARQHRAGGPVQCHCPYHSRTATSEHGRSAAERGCPEPGLPGSPSACPSACHGAPMPLVSRTG